MQNKNLFFFVILIVSFCEKLCASDKFIEPKNAAQLNHDFDVLIFTQRWPITGCIEWMNEGGDHVCILPSQKDIWSIHGIWPTRFGTLGPFFCNKSATFDVAPLKPIIEQLERNWLNIEKGKPETSLWRHEWLKHGTCACVIEDLSTENKYFGQGLAWFQQYEMTGLLAKANITPGAKYNVTAFYAAIKNTLNRNPSIHCVKEKQTQDIYLAEIRVCFNKQLELVDCDGVKLEKHRETIFHSGDNVITNCGFDEEITYPNVVPNYLLNKILPNNTKSLWTFPWVNLYKLVQIMKWFTL